jgi:hypothetical protein
MNIIMEEERNDDRRREEETVTQGGGGGNENDDGEERQHQRVFPTSRPEDEKGFSISNEQRFAADAAAVRCFCKQDFNVSDNNNDNGGGWCSL